MPLLNPRVGAFTKIVINSPGAVSNDGSPAVMYVRPARPGAAEPDGPSADRWVIHFEGGGDCSTYEECQVRWCSLGFYSAAQMSSLPLGETVNRGGLLDRNGINRLGDQPGHAEL